MAAFDLYRKQGQNRDVGAFDTPGAIHIEVSDLVGSAISWAGAVRVSKRPHVEGVVVCCVVFHRDERSRRTRNHLRVPKRPEKTATHTMKMGWASVREIPHAHVRGVW